MPIGYVHLFAFPATVTDSGAAPSAMFQFTFNSGAHSYSRVLDTAQLHELLSEELGLLPDVLDPAMSDLLAAGKTTIANVELSDNEAAALGLVEAGNDY